MILWCVLYATMTDKYRNQQFIDNITKRIDEIRAEKGIVQEDIVDRTGFTLKQVWLLLSGKSNFAISNLEAIAKALEVHPKELLDFDVPITTHDPLRKDRKTK
jgi:transcriptional regulator with XRE-family HTH domain